MRTQHNLCDESSRAVGALSKGFVGSERHGGRGACDAIPLVFGAMRHA
jgi:hypothetical protein